MSPIKKIFFVITKGNWGGAQKYVYELATHLPQDTFQPTVVHGVGDSLPEKLASQKVPTILIPELGRDVNPLKDISVFLTLLRLFRKERPDIAHVNSSKIGGIGALAARCARIPQIIFTVHGLASDEDRPWIQKKIISFISWITIILCTQVICISNHEYTRFSSWPFVQNKLHLIYNGIAEPEFLERHEAQKVLASHIHQPENIFHNKTVIVSIGELTKNKGYSYALEALKDVQDYIYIIIGSGELKTELEKTIHHTSLHGHVFLAGPIPQASTLLKASDIFLLSSVKEGVPYVILEAGFAQIPVIATEVGGIPEIITHHVSGILVTPKNAAAITTALSELSPKDLRNTYAEMLYTKISTEFSLQNMIESTVKLYTNS